jgi:hypothetical protein
LRSGFAVYKEASTSIRGQTTSPVSSVDRQILSLNISTLMAILDAFLDLVQRGPFIAKITCVNTSDSCTMAAQ